MKYNKNVLAKEYWKSFRCAEKICYREATPVQSKK